MEMPIEDEITGNLFDLTPFLEGRHLDMPISDALRDIFGDKITITK